MNKLFNIFGHSDPEEDEGGIVPLEEPSGEEDAENLALAEAIHVGSVAETRRLPSLESALFHPSRRIVYGQAHNIGMVRENNEDAVFTFYASQENTEETPDFGVFIVADGAGGHEEGEQASTVVSRAVADRIFRCIYQPTLGQQLGAAPEDDNLPISEVLSAIVHEADEIVKTAVPGGGTTLTAAVLMGSLVHIAHVGDSRAYLIREQPEDGAPQVEVLTRDHSVVKRLEEIGHITAAEAANHPEAGRLWMIMGLTENLDPDIFTRRLPPASYLVVCSDGLWNMVAEDEIVDKVLSAPTPQIACDELVVAANAYGGRDNISVIIVQIPGEG